MQLIVTVVAAPGLQHFGGPEQPPGPPEPLLRGPVELAIDISRGASGAVIERHLARTLPPQTRLWAHGRPLSTLIVGDAPLVSGAVLIAAAPQWAPPHRGPIEDGLYLAVLSGPDCGHLTALQRGKYTVGRSGIGISIGDPSLSRIHAELTVAPSQITVRDRNSSNGIHVDGVKRTTAVITTNSLIAFGTTSCALRSGPAEDILPGGADISEPLIIEREPDPQPGGKMLIVALLPLALGVVLALATGMWMFLAFSAMSAITVLLSVAAGRRRRHAFRESLADAVEADRLRRNRAAPAIADIALASFSRAAAAHRDADSDRPSAGDSGSGVHRAAGPDPRWVKLGTADQPSNVRLRGQDGSFKPPLLVQSPVLLDRTRVRRLRISGPPLQRAGLVRLVLLQLTAPHGAVPPCLIVLGSPAALPVSLHSLAEVVHTRATLERALGASGSAQVVLVILAAKLFDVEIGPVVEQFAAANVLTVIWCAEDDAEAAPTPGADSDTAAAVHVSSDFSAALRHGSHTLSFQPDLVSARTFDRFVRRRAMLTGVSGTQAGDSALPRICAFDIVNLTGASEILSAWHRDTGATLSTNVGLSRSGPVNVDLQRDGPHLLLAGTTGSGKSELLRALVLGLAAAHSPERVTFLFIDFKGGSGLGPLQSLPHCVGMLTDLSPEAVSRSLVSLQAEVKRRERLFAAAHVADLLAFQRVNAPGAAPLPHLVLVIDEFRMLMEEVPEAMDELMRIATVGRSLGIHLVLSTQRPQGAISADIRANVSTTIALRVRTGFESQDLIETQHASSLSADQPGRAYLKRAGEPPLEFQSASTAHSASPGPGAEDCRVVDLCRTPAGVEQQAEAPAELQEGALQVCLDHSAEANGQFARRSVPRPVAPSLPLALNDMNHAPWPGNAAGAELTIALGLIDLPALQRVDELIWQPAEHSHLALIGTSDSGLHDGVRSVLTHWLRHGPAQAHLYLLDADGTMAALKDHPQVGAYVGTDDLRRAARVFERLADTLATTLADTVGRPETAGAVRGLMITGWGRWVTALRQSPWADAEDTLLEIIRDGQRARIAVLLCGDREVVTSRFFAAVPNRIYFPAGASPESLLAWPKLPAITKVPGRAYVQGAIAAEAGVAQLASCRSIQWPEAAAATDGTDRSGLPFRVDALPEYVSADSLRGCTVAEGELLLGLAGDDPQPVSIALAPAEVLLILGPPRSGRSNVLAALTEINGDARTWVRCAQADAAAFWEDYRRSSADGGPGSAASTVLLLDDVDRLAPDTQQCLTALHARGHAIVMTAASGPGVMTKIPLGVQARNSGKGMLLSPRTPYDGDFFGVRAEVEQRLTPGRAAVVDAGRVTRAQVAHVQ